MSASERQTVLDDALRKVEDCLQALVSKTEGASDKGSALGNAYELVFQGALESPVYEAVEHLHRAYEALTALGDRAEPSTVRGYIELAKQILDVVGDDRSRPGAAAA